MTPNSRPSRKVTRIVSANRLNSSKDIGRGNINGVRIENLQSASKSAQKPLLKSKSKNKSVEDCINVLSSSTEEVPSIS